MLTPFASDPQQRTRALTRGIISVGTIIILAMWAVVIASIIAAREAAIDRARSEGRNLAIAGAVVDQAHQFLHVHREGSPVGHGNASPAESKRSRRPPQVAISR